MADEYTVRDPDGTTRTTVVERRGSGATLLIGLAILLIFAVAAGLFLFNAERNDNARTEAVTTATQTIDRAADKAGDAADRAGDEIDRAGDRIDEATQ